MRTSATDQIFRSLSVSALETLVSPAKMAEPFGGEDSTLGTQGSMS